jgi:hypothetical protein
MTKSQSVKVASILLAVAVANFVLAGVAATGLFGSFSAGAMPLYFSAWGGLAAIASGAYLMRPVKE